MNLREKIANEYNLSLKGKKVPPPPGELVKVPSEITDDAKAPDLVLRFSGAGSTNDKVVIPAKTLVAGPYKDGCVSHVRAAGPEANIVGMPYFISSEKTIFSSRDTPEKPSLTVLSR